MLIFLSSVLSIFLELAVIRWVSAEIHIFAYLQHILLLVSFLGLAAGSFSSFRVRAADLCKPAAIFFVLCAVPFTRRAFAGISYYLRPLSDPYNFALDKGFTVTPRELAGCLLGLALTTILSLSVWFIFVPIGGYIGERLRQAPHGGRAYAVHLFGSLVGAVGFSICSFLWLEPVSWFLLCAALMVVIALGSRELDLPTMGWSAVLVAGVVLATGNGEERVIWSPYQKLTVRPADLPGSFAIELNNLPFTGVMDLRESFVRAHADRFSAVPLGYSQYDLPYRFYPGARSVLIVGAGPGNDAAAANRHAVPDVVAVEIDPAVAMLGRALHPERPYDNPAVQLVNDDARAYFANANRSFDIIDFAALDAHSAAGPASHRLDHYVYTKESLAQARSLLKEHGILFMTFHAVQPFLVARLAGTLREVFGSEPLVFVIGPSGYSAGTVAFVAGNSGLIRTALSSDSILQNIVREGSSTTFAPFSEPVEEIQHRSELLPSDNWPFLYLPQPRIPAVLVAVWCSLAAAFAGIIRKNAAGTRLAPAGTELHFLFLGMGFLPLEMFGISRAAIVLGSTWMVTAFLTAAVLVAALAGALGVRFWPRRWLPAAYLLLGATIAGVCVSDQLAFLFGTRLLRLVVLGLLVAVPFFFTSVVFTASFERADDRRRAFAANLLGALVGAVLHALVYIWGSTALLLTAAISYAAAYVTRPRVQNAVDAQRAAVA